MQNIIPLNYANTDLWGAKSSVRIYEQICIVQGFNDTRSSSNQLYKVLLSPIWVLSLSMPFNTVSFLIQFSSYS